MSGLDELRTVADAATTGHAWEWSARGEHGYPQQVISQGDVVLVAECYESPDFPSAFADFIATFDPPTVIALLDRLAAAEAAVERVAALRDEWATWGPERRIFPLTAISIAIHQFEPPAQEVPC